MRATLNAACLAAFAAAGCYNIKQVSFGEFPDKRIRHVWVTRADDSVMELREAEVINGKLRGFANREMQELEAGDLKQIKIRQLASGRTAALVVGASVAFIGVAILVSGNEDTFDPCVGGRPDCNMLARANP